MSDGVERTVKIGEMTYVDPKGHSRRASHGATVQVHEDNVDRFDRFNVLPGQEPEQQPEPELVAEPEPEEPKRRGPGRPRKSEQDHG